MDQELAEWLCGQIDCLRNLADHVQSLLLFHDKKAAEALTSVVYACNAASRRVKDVVQATKK